MRPRAPEGRIVGGVPSIYSVRLVSIERPAGLIEDGRMIALILIGLLRGVRTQRSVVLENLALRHQLVVLQRTAPHPRLRTADRLFFWVSHPFNPSRCSKDRLRPFVKPGPRSERHPTCSVWRFRRKAEEGRGERTDRPTGDFRVAGAPQARTLRRLACVAMMEAADHGCRDDPALALHRSWLRGVLVQGEVRSATVVVGEVVAQQVTQMGFVQHHHVVETLAA